MKLVIGGAYAVSVGLLIYVHQSQLMPDDVAFPLLIGWVAFGGLIAVAALLRGGE